MSESAKKVRQGLYKFRGFYLLQTQKYDRRDACWDWVAIQDRAQAERAWNGSGDFAAAYAHNTKRDLMAEIRTATEGGE